MKIFILKLFLILALFNINSYASSEFCSDIVNELEKDISSFRDRPYYDQTISYGFDTVFKNMKKSDSFEMTSLIDEVLNEEEYIMKINKITGTNFFTDYIKNNEGNYVKIIRNFKNIDELINENDLIKSNSNIVYDRGSITKEQFTSIDNYITAGDYIISINGLDIKNKTFDEQIQTIIENHSNLLNQYDSYIESNFDGDTYEFVRRKVVVDLNEVFRNDLIDQLESRKNMNDFSYKVISGYNGIEYNENFVKDYINLNQNGRSESDPNSEQFYYNFPIEDLKLRLGIYRPSNFPQGHIIDKDKDIFYVDVYPDYKNDITSVNLDYKLGDIRDIDVQNNIFVADYFLSKNWIDYDLGSLASNIVSQKEKNTNEHGAIVESNEFECIFFSNDKNFEVINKIWRPEYRKLNQLSVEKNKFQQTFKIRFYLRTKFNSPRNFASITLDESGTSQFTINFNYSAFPFDIQRITIGLEQSNPKVITNFRDKDKKVNFFSTSETVDLSQSLDQFAHKLSGWSIFRDAIYDTSYEPITIRKDLKSEFGVDQINGELSIRNKSFAYFFLKEDFLNEYSSVFQYSQEIQRNWKYFLFKIIAPIILILIVCWSIFWTPSRELESRLTVTITCFLALVAYTFVIDDDLPKLSYLTLMDFIILISYFYAAMPTILSVVSHRIHKRSDTGALRLDNFSKFVGPITYLIFIYIIIFGTVSPENSIQALKSITFK